MKYRLTLTNFEMTIKGKIMTDTPTVYNTELTSANRLDIFTLQEAAAYLDRHIRVVNGYLKRPVNPLTPDRKLNGYYLMFYRQTLHAFHDTMPKLTEKQEATRQKRKAVKLLD